MNHRIISVLIGLVIIVTVVGGVVYWRWPELVPRLTTAPAEAAPTIKWTPVSVSEIVGQGQSKTVQVSFTASENVSDVVVRVVPELQAFVQVSPASFPNITKGQTLVVNIILSASPTAPLGTATGAIQLRSGKGAPKTFARPLPVAVEVWQLFRDEGVGLTILVPPDFSRVDESVTHEPLVGGGGDTIAMFQTPGTAISNTDAPAFGCFVQLGIEDNSTLLSLIEWLDVQSFRRPEDVDEVIEVDGVAGVRRTSVDEISGEPFVMVFVPQGNTVVTLNLIAHGEVVVVEDCTRIFDVMLSSLRLGA